MAHGHDTEDFLISKLLDETYQSLPSHDDPCRSPDLSEHFERHNLNSNSDLDPTLENFLNRQAISIYKLEYSAHTGCYRLNLQGHKIDLPGNWGAFVKLGRETSYVDLTEDELGEIFLSLSGLKSQVVLVGKFGCAQLAMFECEDEFSLRWLEKYFALEEKKEAA